MTNQEGKEKHICCEHCKAITGHAPHSKGCLPESLVKKYWKQGDAPYWKDVLEKLVEWLKTDLAKKECKPFEFAVSDWWLRQIHLVKQASYDLGREKGRRKVINEVQNIDPLWLAECFHDFYESFAKIKGWKTQKNCTNVPFKDLPKENKDTMICTASSVALEIAGKVASLTPKDKEK